MYGSKGISLALFLQQGQDFARQAPFESALEVSAHAVRAYRRLYPGLAWRGPGAGAPVPSWIVPQFPLPTIVVKFSVAGSCVPHAHAAAATHWHCELQI